jgi:spore germination protein YaaH
MGYSMSEQIKQDGANKRTHRGALVLVMIVLVIAIGAGYEFMKTFGPNHHYTDLDDYLGLQTEDQLALLVNTNVTGKQALVVDEACYLPLDYLQEVLDERLYLDSEQEALLYAKPTDLVVAKLGESTILWGANEQSLQAPGLILQESEYYISLELLEALSDCVCLERGEAPVLWLWNDFEEAYSTLRVQKDGEPMRTAASIRSEIVTDLDTETILYSLYQEGNYTYCIAQNGLMGYVRTKELTEGEPVTAQRTREADQYTAMELGETVRMGWHQMDENNYIYQTDRLQELAENAVGLNVVSPTWYSVADADGSLNSLADADYVNKAHELGLLVWALVDNFNSDVDNYALLSSYSARSKMINQLVTDGKNLGFDGINIDFEAAASGLGGLDQSCGVHFMEFLRELSIQCRKEGLYLSVDNYVPAAYNRYYNREEQGKIVDYVVVMGYDEHYAGSATSGSVASYDFVKSGIEGTLEEVPKEKVILAVPFYTRVWQVDENGTVLGSEAKGVRSMEQFLDEQGLTTVWKETEHQNYADYTLEGVHYQVWLEDADSLQWKLDFVDTYQLAGISCWKLGLEPGTFWEQITK